MITVKQYADERGITIQAVHQSMNGKRKKALLQGHVVMKEGIKYLDNEAVEILDKDRHKSQYIIEKENSSETIQALKEQVEALLLKTTAQADKIAELSEWKADNAVAIAEANNRQLLLEAANRDKEHLQASLAESEAARKLAEQQAQVHGEELEALRASELELRSQRDAAAAELEEEKSRKISWKEFWSRRKGK